MTDDNMAAVEPDDARLSSLRAAAAAAQSAPLTPVRNYNRLMTAVQKECDKLAASPDGRVALEHAAAQDPEPMVRLSAAVAVSEWDAEAGRSALEALVLQSGASVVRPMSMTAALAVRDEPGRSAALCLLNLDRGVKRGPSTPAGQLPRPVVAAALLDAAEKVYGLAMNGGIAHAYELAGNQFNAAAAALEAVGAPIAAGVLREAVRLLVTPVKASRVGTVDAELARLDEQLAGLEVMALLEQAADS